MREPTPPLTGPEAEKEMRRLSRRGFLFGAAAAAAAIGGWRWLTTSELEDGIHWPLRRVMHWDDRLSQAYYARHRLAPTFPAEMVQGPARVNAMVGLSGEVDAATWQIQVQHAGRDGDQKIPLREVLELPRTELATEFKCVEGWSQIMLFHGVRFIDFLTHFKLGTRSGKAPDPDGDPADLYRYVALSTPDEAYYVSIDMPSALNPQTMLCDAMNREPLTRQHGAPLRLYLSVKYGYKSLKRVGRIRFQDERPGDYWSERGYDWYGGL